MNDDNWYQNERLHRAASAGDVEEIKSLLNQGLPINAFDGLSWTPLHHAAMEGHIEAVQYLIKAGANVNAHEGERIGDTPLGEIAANCSLEMAKTLVEAGADPTILGWMTLTALDRSAERKKPEGKRVHQLLLETARRLHPNWPRLRTYL